MSRIIAMNDPLDATERGISETIRAVTPLIRRIVSRYAHAEGSVSREDAEDVIATVHLRLLQRLRSDEAIESIDDYVAALTYNALSDFLRSRYPRRTQLKNRLRYVLTHDPRLSMWEGRACRVAGLKEREGEKEPPFRAELPRERATRAMMDAAKPADAVHEILRAGGGVMTFDALVELTAALWSIADAPLLAMEQCERTVPAPAEPDPRELLDALWREIGQLPLAQRRALLLNLRHSETANVVELFARTGTASFGQIAAAMEMSADDLGAIWNELPLPDQRIASMLRLSRQQVINLRMAARKRLARRVLKGNR